MKHQSGIPAPDPRMALMPLQHCSAQRIPRIRLRLLVPR
jgi:hypothetical protein